VRIWARLVAALVFGPLVFVVLLDAGWTLLTWTLGVRDGVDGQISGGRGVLLTAVPLGLVVAAGLTGWYLGRRTARAGVRPDSFGVLAVLGLAATLWPVYVLYEMGAGPWIAAGVAFTLSLAAVGVAATALVSRGRVVPAVLVALVGGLFAAGLGVTLRIYLDNVLRASAPPGAFAKPVLATDALWWFPASVVDPVVDFGLGAYWDTAAVAEQAPLAPLHPFTHLLLACAAFGLALTLSAVRRRA